jgi:hypothetical protein
VTRTALALVGHEVTVDDSKARRELGYQGKVTIDAGLAQMTDQRPGQTTGQTTSQTTSQTTR